MKKTDEGFMKQALEYGVPEHDVDGLWLYMIEGIPPGGFLEAVLENNLKEALGKADSFNQKSLKEIVSFLYCCFPSSAWGSPEKVSKWISDFRNLSTGFKLVEALKRIVKL